MHVTPVFKKNALQALFYVIITWTVTHALGIPLTYCLGMLFIPFGAWVAADYAERTVILRKWHPEIWMSCFFFVLGVSLYFREDWAEKYIIVGNYIAVSGILVLLADQLFGFGMERVARVTSHQLKWAWTIWKYFSVIVGIFVTHTIYDCSQHSIFKSTGCIIEFNDEIVNRYMYAFTAFGVLRIIQIFLALGMLYVTTDQEERERGGPLGRKQR